LKSIEAILFLGVNMFLIFFEPEKDLSILQQADKLADK